MKINLFLVLSILLLSTFATSSFFDFEGTAASMKLGLRSSPEYDHTVDFERVGFFSKLGSLFSPKMLSQLRRLGSTHFVYQVDIRGEKRIYQCRNPAFAHALNIILWSLTYYARKIGYKGDICAYFPFFMIENVFDLVRWMNPTSYGWKLIEKNRNSVLFCAENSKMQDKIREAELKRVEEKIKSADLRGEEEIRRVQLKLEVDRERRDAEMRKAEVARSKTEALSRQIDTLEKPDDVKDSLKEFLQYTTKEQWMHYFSKELNTKEIIQEKFKAARKILHPDKFSGTPLFTLATVC